MRHISILIDFLPSLIPTLSTFLMQVIQYPQSCTPFLWYTLPASGFPSVSPNTLQCPLSSYLLLLHSRDNILKNTFRFPINSIQSFVYFATMEVAVLLEVSRYPCPPHVYLKQRSKISVFLSLNPTLLSRMLMIIVIPLFIVHLLTSCWWIEMCLIKHQKTAVKIQFKSAV